MTDVDDWIRSEVENWLGHEITEKVFQEIAENTRDDDDFPSAYDNFIEDALLAKQAGCSPFEFMAHRASSLLPEGEAEWIRLFMEERQAEIDCLANEVKRYIKAFDDLLRRCKIKRSAWGVGNIETDIESIKDRISKFYRTPNKLRQQMQIEAHALKRKLLEDGKSSRAANDIIIDRLEGDPIYHELAAGFTKDTWKKFLQLPKTKP